MKSVYEADDGSTHRTAESAHKRDRLLKAKRAFECAAREVIDCLGRMAKTADGQTFDPRTQWAYWRIVRYLGGGMPYIVRVDGMAHEVEIDIERHAPRLAVRYFDREQNKHITLAIHELYADESKCKAAWLEACREYAADVAKALAEIEAKNGGVAR